MGVSLNPVGPRVVAQQEEAQSKTASGIYLPDSAQEKPKVANVISVGAGTRIVKKGDRIVYKEYAATEIKIDGERFLVINEEDVLATVG